MSFIGRGRSQRVATFQQVFGRRALRQVGEHGVRPPFVAPSTASPERAPDRTP